MRHFEIQLRRKEDGQHDGHLIYDWPLEVSYNVTFDVVKKAIAKAIEEIQAQNQPEPDLHPEELMMLTEEIQKKRSRELYAIQ